MNDDSTKKGFIQVWKELTWFLSVFAIIGWLIATLREDKPWYTLALVAILFTLIEVIYLTGYWVFVGFKNKNPTP